MTTVIMNSPSATATAPIQLNLHVIATLNMNSAEARQLVNRKIIPELGTGLIAREPELVIQNDQVIWRVPIALSLPTLGDMGQVGSVDLDARTGELSLAVDQRERMIEHASRLYAGATLQAK